MPHDKGRMERDVGIEPTSLAWKARAHPLYQSRKISGDDSFGADRGSPCELTLGFVVGPETFSPAGQRSPDEGAVATAPDYDGGHDEG